MVENSTRKDVSQESDRHSLVIASCLYTGRGKRERGPFHRRLLFPSRSQWFAYSFFLLSGAHTYRQQEKDAHTLVQHTNMHSLNLFLPLSLFLPSFLLRLIQCSSSSSCYFLQRVRQNGGSTRYKITSWRPLDRFEQIGLRV